MTISPPERVPTLTEVVDQQAGTVRQRPEPPVLVDELADAQPPAVRSALFDEAALVQRITDAVQRDLDRLVEERLSAALGPLMAQWVDDAAHLVRLELASTLRESVVRAVADETGRHRNGDPPR